MKPVNEGARGLLNRPGSTIAKSCTNPSGVHADKRRKNRAQVKISLRKGYD